MTIIEAIKQAIVDIDRPANFLEIYDVIIDKNYYSFGAKDPISVIRVKLRVHASNVNIISGKNKAKHFKSEGGKGKEERFSLLAEPLPQKNIDKIKSDTERSGKESIVLKTNFIKKLKKYYKNFDFLLHKITLIECFWMLFGAFLPIIVDSFLRIILLDSKIKDAFQVNLKGGEVFLLSSALISPFLFFIIQYIKSDDETKKANKLPYFGWVLFLTIISLVLGVIMFVYYRIGQHIKINSESELIKAMFSHEFGLLAFGVFATSLSVWYYSSFMNHRGVGSYKAIRKSQQQDLEDTYNTPKEG